MKNIVRVTVLIVAAVLATAFSPATAHAAKSGCLSQPECVDTTGNAGVQPGWTSTQWLRNDDFWFERGIGKCGNGTRNTIFLTGGWVSALNTPSEIDCTSSYPNLVAAGFDWKDEESGSTFTRHWVTIP